MSSNNTSTQPHCLHTDSTPRAVTAATAAEAFCSCMEQHVLRNAIDRIATEEVALRRVEQCAENLLREEGVDADLVRARIDRAAGLIRRARVAWRGGKDIVDNTTGQESTPNPTLLVQPDDNHNDADHGTNNADEQHVQDVA